MPQITELALTSTGCFSETSMGPKSDLHQEVWKRMGQRKLRLEKISAISIDMIEEEYHTKTALYTIYDSGGVPQR
jgi:hypothetical protein